MTITNKNNNKMELFLLIDEITYSIYNHRTTKTNQKYPSVNL